MATIEELGNALKKADAAGNSADAKVLADEIRKMQGTNYTSPTALTQGIVGGVADLAGSPADLGKSALETYMDILGNTSGTELFPASGGNLTGGSQYLRQKASGFKLPSGNPATYQNIEQVPESFRPLAVAGETLGGTIPLMFAPYAGGMGAVSKFAKTSPYKFLVGEMAGGTGAALGAGWAEEFSPGNMALRVPLEIAGGFLHPSSLVARHAGGLIQNIKEQVNAFFTRSGRETAVGSYLQKALQEAGEDPARVSQLLKEQNLVTGLTSGQKTGSPTLLAMESALVKQNPILGDEFKGRAQKALGDTRQLIDQLQSTGDPALLRTAAQLRQNYFNDVLTGRFRKAQQELSSKLANLSGNPTAASQQASSILENALGSARQTEKELWDSVPQSVEAGTQNTLNAYQELQKTMLPEEKVSPLVTAVMQRLGPKAITTPASTMLNAQGVPFTPSSTSQVTSTIPASDLYRLRSRMLSASRDARGAGEFDKARQFNAIAEGAYNDLSQIESPQGQVARDYSRSLNDAFTRTFASDALAKDSSGAMQIHPETLLDKAFGSGGTPADIKFRQLQAAAEFGGGSMVDQQDKFLRSAAASSIGLDGRLNADKLQKFLADNSAILDRFPTVKADLSNAVTAENLLRGVESGNAEATKAIRQKSAFAHLINYEDPAKAISNIVSGKTPVQDFGKLTSLAWRTGKGEVEGLKAATLDYAANQAMKGGQFSFEDFHNALNGPLTSRGPSLMEMMQRTAVMSPAEANRLKQITSEAAKINNALKTRAALDMTNTPDGLYDLVVRIAGANVGSAMSVGTGAPIVAAGAGSKFARKLFEKVPLSKAQDVMIDAAKNPDFAAALLDKNITKQQAQKTQRFINAFLIQSGLTSQTQPNEP